MLTSCPESIGSNPSGSALALSISLEDAYTRVWICPDPLVFKSSRCNPKFETQEAILIRRFLTKFSVDMILRLKSISNDRFYLCGSRMVGRNENEKSCVSTSRTADCILNGDVPAPQIAGSPTREGRTDT